MKGVAEIFNFIPGHYEEKGVARVHAFNIDEQEAKIQNLGSLMNRKPSFMRVSKGDHIKLYVNDTLMMSDTDMEKRTNLEFILNAHGDVMVAGLGIGLILHNLEEKVKSGEVTSITVYEKYQDVIDLIAPYYSHLPLKIKCEDILTYKPPKDETYDTIYFDIWATINTDNLDEIRMLHNRWKNRKRKGGWMDSWMKKYLQDRKREENRQYAGFW